MTTWPPHQTPDPWSAATMAARVPETVPLRAAAGPAATHFAWSAEPPWSAPPLPIEQPHRRFTRSRALTFIGGALVVAAAAGLFSALHDGAATAVDTTTHTVPAPVVAPAAPPAAAPSPPAPAPVAQPKPTAANHQVVATHRSSGSVSRQSPPAPPQPDHDSVSTPPTWDRHFFYWLTHRHDHESHWTRVYGHSK
jgi:hypothetical protein